MTYRNFDQERKDRIAQIGLSTFTLAGETFTLRDDVRPDILALWDEFGARPEGAEPVSQRRQVEVIDQVWTELLVAEDGERYHAVRARPDGPGLIQLIRAAEWAVEEITSRPFEQSSGSGTQAAAASPPGSSTAPPLRVAAAGSASTSSGTHPT